MGSIRAAASRAPRAASPICSPGWISPIRLRRPSCSIWSTKSCGHSRPGRCVARRTPSPFSRPRSSTKRTSGWLPGAPSPGRGASTSSGSRPEPCGRSSLIRRGGAVRAGPDRVQRVRPGVPGQHLRRAVQPAHRRRDRHRSHRPRRRRRRHRLPGSRRADPAPPQPCLSRRRGSRMRPLHVAVGALRN